MSHAIELGQIPTPVILLCKRLRQHGFEAYLVGGGVRDLLLHRTVYDWDVATSAHPEKVQAFFKRTIPTGIKHGTVTVLLRPDLKVEVTTYRGEGAYSDARHPDSITFVGTIEEDLARRDFTMNAIALDALDHRLVDPLQGALDLERRLIRAVGDPLDRFFEDGLRPMRAVRFAAVLELAVEERTLAAIPQCLHRFRCVSAERIRDELLKLLSARRPSVGIELMRQTGLLAEVLPELHSEWNVIRGPSDPNETIYFRSLRACDQTVGDPVLRLAALLQHLGDASMEQSLAEGWSEIATGGQAQKRDQRCDAIGRRLKLSNEQRERIGRLVIHPAFPLEGWSPAELRRFLHRIGPEHLDDFFALRAGDIGAHCSEIEHLQKLQTLRDQLSKMLEESPALQLSDLAIDGQAVMARLGIDPGPRIGQILKALLERVLEDPSLNQKEILLQLVDELSTAPRK